MTARTDAGPLQLAIRGAPDREALRARIADELGAEATLAVGTCARPCLDVAIDGERAVIAFTPEAGDRRERTIVLASDPEQRRQLLAWLAGNLVRDEAADLLADTAASSPRAEPTPSVDPIAPALVVHAEPSVERVPRATISLSALHLVAPIVAVSAELRVGDQVGVAAIGELGRSSSCGPNDGDWARRFGACSGAPADVVGGGAQLAYYVHPGFAGVHAGVEVDYQRLSLVTMSSSLVESDTSAAAFVGYKRIVRRALTLGAQCGLAVHRLAGTTPSEGIAASPLVRVSVGWSL